MNLELLEKLTEDAEGRVNHLYLDSNGFVTVGVGHLVKGLEEALKLPLCPASSVYVDYHAVKASAPNMPASFYARLCRARMGNEDINALLRSDTLAFVETMKRQFPEYETWPETAQEAVFDMDFNMGEATFSTFHHLIASLHAKDWKSCAGQCHRKPPVSESRNMRTRDLFLAAA